MANPEPSGEGSGLEDFLRDTGETFEEKPEKPEKKLPEKPPKKAKKAEKAVEEAPVDASEPLRMATVVGAYRYKGAEGKDVMLELGHPAIVLLLAYLLTLPGVIMEFFMLKSLWYFGFDLYSTYVFVLATGCVVTGFFVLFRKPGSRLLFSSGNRWQFLIAAVATTISLILLLYFGRDAPELAILLSAIVVVSMISLLASSPRVERKEALSIATYGAGAVIAALVPVHQAFGIWGGGGGALGFTLFDGALVVIGVSISFVALNSMRMQTSLFSCWLLGATMVALVAFHELAAIQASGSFEIYDQVLALEGAVFSIVPLSLYFLRELESARLWTHIINATRLLDRRNYERALIEMEEAMELLSKTGYATKLSLPWSVYGDIYYAMGRMNRANTCYEMALQISPNNSEALLNMGNMHAVKGEMDLAVASYMKASDINSEDPRVWNNLGVIYLSQQKFDDALAAFERAISRDEKFPMPYYNAATILQRSGKPAAAMELLEKLMDIAPGDADFRRAHERGKLILDEFQQAAGWRVLGIDVTALVRTLIQDPDGFDNSYKEFLDNVISDNASNAFGSDRKRATDALQGLLEIIGDFGEEVARLEQRASMTKYQLKYAVASLILSGKARFSTIGKEIMLVSTEEGPQVDEVEREISDARARTDTLRRASTLT
jgi:tetratricopeptide (TPR) repeat protein